MAQKINLAVLNKKKEEIDQKEMREARGGAEGRCPSCSSMTDNTETIFLLSEGISCGCGSIWVIFGLSVG